MELRLVVSFVLYSSSAHLTGRGYVVSLEARPIIRQGSRCLSITSDSLFSMVNHVDKHNDVGISLFFLAINTSSGHGNVVPVTSICI